MRQVVCLAAEPWSSLPTRTQQLMLRMKGANVLYFEPAPSRSSTEWKRPGRKLRDHLIAYTLPPALLPVPKSRVLSRYDFNRSLTFIRSKLKLHNFRDPLLWCASPAAAPFWDNIGHHGLVYDCYRDWPSYPESWESELAAQADVVFAASPDLMRHLAPCNSNVTLLPFGCSYPMFAKDSLSMPAPLRRLRRPIFGFVGTLWPDLDLEPVIRLAAGHPDWNVVLVGRNAGCRMLPALRELPNVQLVGQVDPVDVPDYLAAFDACLHLLCKGKLDDDVIPPRMFEYLSSGKPTVAMLRPDQVERFPDVVYNAHTPAEFAALCAEALKETGVWARQRRRAYGQAASWSARADSVNRILESIGLFE